MATDDDNVTATDDDLIETSPIPELYRSDLVTDTSFAGFFQLVRESFWNGKQPLHSYTSCCVHALQRATDRPLLSLYGEAIGILQKT